MFIRPSHPSLTVTQHTDSFHVYPMCCLSLLPQSLYCFHQKFNHRNKFMRDYLRTILFYFLVSTLGSVQTFTKPCVCSECISLTFHNIVLNELSLTMSLQLTEENLAHSKRILLVFKTEMLLNTSSITSLHVLHEVPEQEFFSHLYMEATNSFFTLRVPFVQE
jgi:hypothetical protein